MYQCQVFFCLRHRTIGILVYRLEFHVFWDKIICLPQVCIILGEGGGRGALVVPELCSAGADVTLNIVFLKVQINIIIKNRTPNKNLNLFCVLLTELIFSFDICLDLLISV